MDIQVKFTDPVFVPRAMVILTHGIHDARSAAVGTGPVLFKEKKDADPLQEHTVNISLFMRAYVGTV